MTTKDIGIAVVAAGVGALVVGFAAGFFDRSTEDGIRVKNGTIEIRTESGSVFEESGNKLRTKENFRTCFAVIVSVGDCGGGPTSVYKARSFEVTSAGSTPSIAVIHEFKVAGRKLTLSEKERWELRDNNVLLYHPDAPQKVTAAGTGGKSLSCTARNGALDFYVTGTDC